MVRVTRPTQTFYPNISDSTFFIADRHIIVNICKFLMEKVIKYHFLWGFEVAKLKFCIIKIKKNKKIKKESDRPTYLEMVYVTLTTHTFFFGLEGIFHHVNLARIFIRDYLGRAKVQLTCLQLDNKLGVLNGCHVFLDG